MFENKYTAIYYNNIKEEEKLQTELNKKEELFQIKKQHLDELKLYVFLTIYFTEFDF